MFRALCLATVVSLFLNPALVAQQASSAYEIVAAGGTNGPGAQPAGGLVRGPDGNFYGTATKGGANGGGTVFKMTPEGVLSPLISFSYDDGEPHAGLIVGADGHLYGTTRGPYFYRGANSRGTIFRVTLQGQLTVLATFRNSRSEGVVPNKLMQASDGNFYGTTRAGGTQQRGSIFRMTPNGTVTTLVSFDGNNGGQPYAGLIQGSDGQLYGTTSTTIFRVTLDGAFTTLAVLGLGSEVGSWPTAELTEGGDGNFYGVTSSGAENRGGAVFKMTRDGVLTRLGSLPAFFSGVPSGVVFGQDGNLYGTTMDRFYRVSPSGGLTLLSPFPFTASIAHGREAIGGLLPLGNGEFLGTTLIGGNATSGTVFRISEAGSGVTVTIFPVMLGRRFMSELSEPRAGELYGVAFDDARATGFSATDRQTPGAFKIGLDGNVSVLRPFTNSVTLDPTGQASRLVQGPDGNLYGTVSEGGMLIQRPPEFNMAATGFIYRVAPDGQVSTVYQFAGYGDGSPNEPGDFPLGVVVGPDSHLYGTTRLGGTHGRGTFFKLDLQGNLSPLASFSQGSTGGVPMGELIFSEGFFYGLTSSGGENGTGTFFRATPEGQITLLMSFPAERYVAFGTRLILSRDGNFYGVFSNGGAHALGSVFRVTKAGVLTTFASLDANTGSRPRGIMEASDGNFYGVTGSFDHPGSIFRVDRDGKVTVLVQLNEEIGMQPEAGLMQASDGHLYGTTAFGGPSRNGVIFRLRISAPSQLLNISTRLRVQTGENVLIGGFIVTGNEPKKVILRGIGPSLPGVQNTLANPTLELRRSSGELLAMNDDWKESQQAEIEATTIRPARDLESAVVRELEPGAYTAILSGKGGGTGIGLVEAYDLAPEADSKLANISTRGFVEAGDDAMIGGLIVGGAGSKVIVRALGPSLQRTGISNALADPTLELRNAEGALIAGNDNWKDDPAQAAEIQASGVPPEDDFESAIAVTLPSGPSTAVVRGKADSTGVGLVEVYQLSN